MKIIPGLFIIFLWNYFFGEPTSQNEWKLERSQNNIEVYSRLVEGNSIKELKAIARSSAPISDIEAMIRDISNYPQWVYNCTQAAIINQVNETEYYYYQVNDLPWPATNRDVVVHSRIFREENSGKTTITLEALPDLIEHKPGLVRIPKFDGLWELIPTNDDSVTIVQQILVDPGGTLPEWLVNRASVDGPYNTMFNMIEQLQDGRYETSKILLKRGRSKF